ncbi:hypothetical protein DZE36_07330 [Xanthomonas campestris pv. campestris]|nr:hypothetical protein AAW18_12105 [Xanthomonas campestris pv. campestris]RFF55994.1 hypothetical protein D0A36_17960 [Xanthomonas campestris]QCX68679.1 hypothetical protein DFG55_21755 [Xanthomonas campestris pv. campestris]RFF53504.1 hypothetical protein D0A42_01760 [Xanthomonas campestris pv. campestris]RFF71371.1 hypothetical protein D0A39_11230 [Xanthomonas campestris pv. campestris]
MALPRRYFVDQTLQGRSRAADGKPAPRQRRMPQRLPLHRLKVAAAAQSRSCLASADAAR